MQSPHQDDAKCSCHIGNNYEGLQLMLCIAVDSAFYYEKPHLPFGRMLILSNDVAHSGCLGSCGSFCFQLEIKDLKRRGAECLVHQSDELEEFFHNAFLKIEK